MNWNGVRVAVIVCLVFMLLVVPSAVYPCGPYFFSPEYVLRQPESETKYAAGDLGIPLRSYDRVYAFIAYRYLSGRPLTKEEQTAVFHRNEGVNTFAAGFAPDRSDNIVGVWLTARAAIVPGSSPEIDPFKEQKDYQYFLNCPPPAFATAAETLEDRSKKYSKEELKDWISAQDAVFANCSGKSTENTTPKDAAANASTLVKQDRAYQLAAARFYAGQFDEAIQRFRDIGADKMSPWHVWGEFLAGRALIRKATLNTERADEPFDPKVLGEAESVLRKVVADQELAQVHSAAQQMLGFIDFRLHPAELQLRLASQLSKPASAEIVQNSIGDYLKVVGGDRNRSRDDMSEWMVAFDRFATLPPDSEKKRDPAGELIGNWEERRTLPWLTLAISAAQPGDKGVKEVIAAAEQVKADSPAYPTVQYHLARLAAARHDYVTARRISDAFVAKMSAKAPRSTINMFLHTRLEVATDLNDFLHYAQRKPLVLSAGEFDELDNPCGPEVQACNLMYLDHYAERAFDSMPLEMWIQAALDRELDFRLRGEIALAAWCRAVINRKWAIADQAAKIAVTALPMTEKYMDPYLKAGDPKVKEFAAVFAMLHWPGIRPTMNVPDIRDAKLDEIDNFRSNWWCSLPMSVSWINPNDPKDKEPPRTVPPFVSTSQKQAQAEQRKVESENVGPNYLVPIVIAWAKAHPDDPRVPEALHLSVKTTRYSCSDEKTTPLSKTAFQVLHSKYPKSEWAKKTKYYY